MTPAKGIGSALKRSFFFLLKLAALTAVLLEAAVALARYAQVFIGVGCDTDVLVFCGRLASVIQ
ncbi:MAG TPA: hypothetical protein PL182_02975 [Pseudobdellovibrionaceae bacterium]|nr:hypothetical protein [Pseudobdellovibrionaceae bacterium]